MNTRNALLVDGPHAGELLTVPANARLWEFSDLVPIEITNIDEAPAWRYQRTTYHFHECAILGTLILIGWSRSVPTQSDLAKHLLSPNARTASLPPKPPTGP